MSTYTQQTLTIVAVSGSLRRDSANRRVLEAAAHELPAGVELRFFDGLAAVEPFDQDLETGPVPAGVAAFRAAVAEADAVLISTPEYNGAVPGQLKNALDWGSRPRGSTVFSDKPVATTSASPSPHGAAWAQQNLRKVLGVMGADVVGGELAVPRVYEQFDETGRLADPELRGRLADLVTELAEAAATSTIEPVAA